jgi:hypothetical protein
MKRGLLEDEAAKKKHNRTESQVRHQGDRAKTPVLDLRIKGLVEQEWGPQQPTTKKLARMHEEAQKMLLD